MSTLSQAPLRMMLRLNRRPLRLPLPRIVTLQTSRWRTRRIPLLADCKVELIHCVQCAHAFLCVHRIGSMTRFDSFGDQTKFCEPAWYQGAFTPYYTASHAEFRKRVRDFMAKEVEPYAEGWLQKGEYPLSVHKKMYDVGLQQAVLRVPPELGGASAGM
ncbi:Isobutyryl-CoA dehydrogenase, mitochondrial [Perkinsus olseni]|uniref:Isobutyryl-CoA dehydrogenase, mitochondrial n=1 Tax=Perkinsus olseni TaxID=32597 RepID=A0A7J6R661_PEROL|nr:Isobutyryl-CoA dehydrogenase, mitochondrial [Perkinsus olseni]